MLLLSSSLSAAEEPRGVPEKLFGITLGGVYNVGDPERQNFGNIPIKKFAGIKRFLGRGVHFYFQPKKEYKIFEYVKKRDKPEDQYFKTSFRLYLLPVIPSTIKTKEQLENIKLNGEVTLIEWSNDAKSEEDACYWAYDLCETFKVDILVEPKITDDHESKWYECAFSHGDRVFKVSSFASRRIELSYEREVSHRKNEAVEKIFRKLQADEIRPY